MRFDIDFFSILCFWICCVFDFFFDFKKLREWKSIVCVVFTMKKKEFEIEKKLFLFLVLLFASSLIRRLKTYSFLSFLFLSWIYRFLVLSRLLFWTRKVQNRSKKYKVSWKIYYYWRWCYEFLRDVWFEFFISK